MSSIDLRAVSASSRACFFAAFASGASFTSFFVSFASFFSRWTSVFFAVGADVIGVSAANAGAAVMSKADAATDTAMSFFIIGYYII